MTFAWQSINQEVTNVVKETVNPGGRLHDDFNGENKDVYVENFADEPIFARIQLREYLRIGEGSDIDIGGTLITTSAQEYDKRSTWPIRYYTQTNITDTYVKWEMGGSTMYMPTFNMNKDSLEPDVNGTYEGENNIRDDVDPYSDYVEYTLGEQKSGTAVRDADIDALDQYQEYIEKNGKAPSVSNEYYTLTENETHTVQKTNTAIVMSMAEWKALPAEQQVGPYWVYDTDGWAYWAQPILGQSSGENTTGLLLDRIIPTIDDEYYYAIHVIAQFVTANDVGSTDSSDGFYDVQNGTIPTTDAEALLHRIGAYGTDFQILPNASRVKPGASVTFNAFNAVGTVTYEVEGEADTLTVMNGNILQIGASETMPRLIVKATDEGGNTASYRMAVSPDAPDVETPTQPETPPVTDPETPPVTEPETPPVTEPETPEKGIWSVQDKTSGTLLTVVNNEISVTPETTLILYYNDYDGTIGYWSFLGDATDAAKGVYPSKTGAELYIPKTALGTGTSFTEGRGDIIANVYDTNDTVIDTLTIHLLDTLTITPAASSVSAETARTYGVQLNATFNEVSILSEAVEWSLSGATDSTTSISEAGILTIGLYETATDITVSGSKSAVNGVSTAQHLVRITYPAASTQSQPSAPVNTTTQTPSVNTQSTSAGSGTSISSATTDIQTTPADEEVPDQYIPDQYVPTAEVPDQVIETPDTTTPLDNGTTNIVASPTGTIDIVE